MPGQARHDGRDEHSCEAIPKFSNPHIPKFPNFQISKFSNFQIVPLQIMKNKLLFVCQQCGATSVQWKGKCPSCGAWNSYIEEIIPEKISNAAAGAIPFKDGQITTLGDLVTEDIARFQTKDSEINRVLGGGIVPGSVILLGGEPGIGKSTIMLQLALENKDVRILYVSGEES